MSFLLHLLAPLGDLLGIKCTACKHETKFHYAVGYGTWKCEICGSTCVSHIKIACMHALHGLANNINNITEVIKCTHCNHLTNEHDGVGYGKWKCRQCGMICS